MNLRTKLLLTAACIVLAIPLIFTGNASAIKYNPDGAVLNGTTGLWEMPDVFCAGVSASFITAGDYTADPGYAIKRADLNPSGVNYGTESCTVPYGQSQPNYLTHSSVDTMAECRSKGYTWQDGKGCWPVFWVRRTGGTGDTYGTGGTTWTTSYSSGTGQTAEDKAEYRACLKCHNDAYMVGPDPNTPYHSVYAGKVSKYVNASHKNASRKIVPGKKLANVWIDSAGHEQFGVFPYLPGLNSPSTDGTGGFGLPPSQYNFRMVDWVNGKIEDTTANASFVGLRNLPTGVFTEWYWEFGYYGEDPERGVYNAIARSNGQPSAFMTGCFFCHGTGAVGSISLDATKEPERSFPGISWDTATTYTPGSRPGVVNLRNQIVTRANRNNAALPATYTYGAWDEFGVVCSSCHASSDGSHQNVAAAGQTINWNGTEAQKGASINAVCGQCHVRAGSGNGSVTAPVAEQITLRKNVGTGHPNYHATDFLNSPHARFTGTYGQISDPNMYDSHFLSLYGGCEGCHEPHGSVREPLLELATGNAAPLHGIEASCSECHSAVSVAAMNHPVGPGTPADTHDACVTCHMPGGRHLFRITTEANYTTTQPTAVPAIPDGSFTEAVWIDANLACLQCHSAANAPNYGAPVFTKTQAAAYANGIHNNKPIANFTSSPDTTVAYKVNFSAASSVCPTGHTCSYSWDFGGLGTGTGIATSYEFGSGATVAVTLTVTTNAYTSASITKNVTPSTVNAAPVCSGTAPTAADYVVSFTDSSTDDGAATLYVNWGDGTPVQAFALGSSPSHTYIYKGTYSVRRYVRDSGGLVGDCGTTPVTVGSAAGTTGTLTINTTNTTGSGFSVTAYVKLGSSTKAFSSIPVGASKVFPLAAADYGVWIYAPSGKKCYTDAGHTTQFVNGSLFTVTAGGNTNLNLYCQ
jgi:hypothetical protein